MDRIYPQCPLPLRRVSYRRDGERSRRRCSLSIQVRTVWRATRPLGRATTEIVGRDALSRPASLARQSVAPDRLLHHVVADAGLGSDVLIFALSST